MANEILPEQWTSWEALDEWLCERFEEAYINLGQVKRQQTAVKMFEAINDQENQEAIRIVESYLNRLKVASPEQYTVEQLSPLNLTITMNDSVVSKELNELTVVSFDSLSEKSVVKPI